MIFIQRAHIWLITSCFSLRCLSFVQVKHLQNQSYPFPEQSLLWRIIKRQELKLSVSDRKEGEVLQYFTMCFSSNKACKPILVQAPKKMINLQINMIWASNTVYYKWFSQICCLIFFISNVWPSFVGKTDIYTLKLKTASKTNSFPTPVSNEKKWSIRYNSILFGRMSNFLCVSVLSD